MQFLITLLPCYVISVKKRQVRRCRCYSGIDSGQLCPQDIIFLPFSQPCTAALLSRVSFSLPWAPVCRTDHLKGVWALHPKPHTVVSVLSLPMLVQKGKVHCGSGHTLLPLGAFQATQQNSLNRNACLKDGGITVLQTRRWSDRLAKWQMIWGVTNSTFPKRFRRDEIRFSSLDCRCNNMKSA